MKKVLGMGNALVDILIRMEDDSLLETFSLPKATMQLVDKTSSNRILFATRDIKYEIASGGSASNTIIGLANLGVPTGYIGKIGKDDFGRVFSEDLINKNIEAKLLTGSQDTGIAITLISPDSERTFATYLGSAVELTPGDLVDDIFKGYDFFHIEGYLVQNHELIETAVKLAKKNGLTIALDLASFNVVEANFEFLRRIVANYVDIVFANEEEAKAFTGKDPVSALSEISSMCDMAIVKIGDKGSMVKTKDEEVKVDAMKVVCRDTTGAGDLYAAGFLYGLSTGKTLEQSAMIGGLLGGNVVQVIGAKIDDARWDDIREKIELIK